MQRACSFIIILRLRAAVPSAVGVLARVSLGVLPGGLAGSGPAEQASGPQVKGYFSHAETWKNLCSTAGASSQPTAESGASAWAAITQSLRLEGMKRSQIRFSD